MDPGIEPRHFRHVLAVAEEGTFTAAAARRGMTQPVLSRVICALEGAAGTALFERGHHGATPPDAGKIFRDDARAVDQLARAAVSRRGRPDTCASPRRPPARPAAHDRTRRAGRRDDRAVVGAHPRAGRPPDRDRPDPPRLETRPGPAAPQAV